MDAKAANEELGRSKKKKKKPDSWKLPKISVDQIYKKKSFRIFPSLKSSYVIKDFETTVTLDFTNQDNGCNYKSISLLNRDFMDGFLKKQHQYVHLGLVQVAIKPLTRAGLGAPIIVCLTDCRLRNFKTSLLAMVETDLSNGPFYFHCFPSYSVFYKDIFNFDCLLLTLNVKKSGIPLVVTYRLVCKAMVSLLYSEMALRRLILGETTYFQGNFRNPETTKWDEVQVPKEWTTARG